MVKANDEYVLFIEPRRGMAREPVLDELSAKMREAMAHANPTRGNYLGYHLCVCGAKSETRDYVLHTGQITNSLAVHYLEYHRDEVPRRELEKIRELPPITPEVIARQRDESLKTALEFSGSRPCPKCGSPIEEAHELCCRCDADHDQ